MSCSSEVVNYFSQMMTEGPEMSRKIHPKKEKSPSGFSRYVKRPIKWMLKAWSIASIVTVTVLDIMEMSKWIQAHQGLSGWDHFVCMGCIIITSSNFKRLLGFTTVVLGVFRHLDKGDIISIGLLVILAG
eukprot:405471_1